MCPGPPARKHVCRTARAGRLPRYGPGMGEVRGERVVDIAASVERCFAIAADIQGAPGWQRSLKDVEVVERDAHRRASLVETTLDAKVTTVESTLRFSYDEPREIRWVQEEGGGLRSVEGYWRFEELGPDATRATYGLIVDPGRMLGMLLRGPTEAKVREFLLGGAAEGLKAKAESG
jgi:uncharacterized membrane protein